VAQVRRFGAELLSPLEAKALRTQDGYHILSLSNGHEVASQALILTTGVSYRRLDVPGAERLGGAGLYYGAAITEALASRGQDVYVVGGGNSAGQAAVYLARFARSVTVLVRGRSLAAGMSQYLVERIEGTENIAVRTETSVIEAHGERSLEALTLRGPNGDTETVAARALFLFIGTGSRTDWLGGQIAVDPQGFILTGADLMTDGKRPAGWTAAHRDPFWLETNVPGIFAAGDVRHRSTKRIASAVGEGAMAVQFVHRHLSGPVVATASQPTVGAPN
jgi:thioredoxin reductase (NADPH)